MVALGQITKLDSYLLRGMCEAHKGVAFKGCDWRSHKKGSMGKNNPLCVLWGESGESFFFIPMMTMSSTWY